MTCDDVERLGGAYADGELDLEQALAVEAHVAQCQACAARLQAGQDLTRALRSAPYFKAPAGLAARIRARTSPAAGAPSKSWLLSRPWLMAAASVAVAVLGVTFGVRQQNASATARMAGAVIDHHVASLMAEHLTDVASSDRHTVKPWFAGRIEFSPPVVDLAADGFPLKGGRLDYIDGHPAVALVYTRGAHVINVFMWPTTDDDATPRPSNDPRGYHVVRWTKDRLTWWAVSDLAAADLSVFATKLVAGSALPGAPR